MTDETTHIARQAAALDEAIAMIRANTSPRHGPWTGSEFSCSVIPDDMCAAVATILNAAVSGDLAPPPLAGDAALDEAQKITMTYRNWRGEVGTRTIQPWGLRFDTTDWHPEPGWLLEAWDFDKGAVRDFALADCQFADLARPSLAGDRERVQAMRDANWKPAGTYWRERAEKAEAAEKLANDKATRLVGAVEALGALPDGYCFCSSNRVGNDSKEHEPECRDIRAALSAMNTPAQGGEDG